MKILITGSKGQLGSELLAILKSGKSQLGSIPSSYQQAECIAVDIDELDIGDATAVNDLILKEKPEIIFNCAAMTNVDGCETDFLCALKGNAIGPRNLAVAAEKVGAKLIHVSTDYVFAGDGSKPYVEWDSCNPKTVYGKSKLLGEKYIAQFSNKYFIVRTAWLYGKNGSNFVNTMLKLGMAKSEITVVNDQKGNPTNAEDLAYHLLKLGVTEEYGIYHCTSKGQCTWFDFATMIMAEASLACKVLPCSTAEFASSSPNSAPRPKFSALENLMIEATVGDEMRCWQDGLKSYLRPLIEGNKLK